MCGIAGIFSLNGTPLDRRIVKRMCDSIAHRGPDGAGTAQPDPRVALLGVVNIMLAALVAALAGPQECVSEMRMEFAARRELTLGLLNAIQDVYLCKDVTIA